MNIYDIFKGSDILDIEIPSGWICKILLDSFEIEDFNKVLDFLGGAGFTVFSLKDKRDLGIHSHIDYYDFDTKPVVLNISESAFCVAHPIDDFYMFIFEPITNFKISKILENYYNSDDIYRHIKNMSDKGNYEYAEKFRYFLKFS